MDNNISYIKNIDTMTRSEVMEIALGDELAFDIETYKNYFLIMFYRASDKGIFYFDDRIGFDKSKLEWVLRTWRTYGFNSLGFDLPICVAYSNREPFDAAKVYEMAQAIIHNHTLPAWQILAQYGMKAGWRDMYARNHYDLMGPAFGRHSLKYYGAVLGLKKLQDLPYEHYLELDEAQKQSVFDYCINDCFTTSQLRAALEGPLNIRKEFGASYGTNLLSMQDAKVAETLLVQDYRYKTHEIPIKLDVKPSSITYTVPDYVNFNTPLLQSLLKEMDGAQFNVVDGKVSLGTMEGRVVNIANNTYKMGIGGLHSQESSITHKASEDMMLIDCDVASYYPSLILRNGSYPPALGKQFLETYNTFVKLRLEAKKNGNKLMADGFKIPLNATFGKLGEEHGYLYAPDLLIGVTLTGQLCLLMLIERLVDSGFEVISANTDGIISKVLTVSLLKYREVLAQWMKDTDFSLEETHYTSIYSRDVNNYIAFYADGSGYKAKGAYSKYGLSSLQAKVPDCQIVKDAVIKYLSQGTPVTETIRNCSDILQFTRAKNVKNGGYFKGIKLGKVVRFYYSKTSSDDIRNAAGNKVPEATNVTPCMNLPDTIPPDLCYEAYIARARKIINYDFYTAPTTLDLFA